jgi:hypothetical protein
MFHSLSQSSLVQAEVQADPRFLKAFNTAQYTAQLLAFSQDALLDKCGELEQQIANSADALEATHERFVKGRKAKAQLKKQIRQTQTLIDGQRAVLQVLNPDLLAEANAHLSQPLGVAADDTIDRDELVPETDAGVQESIDENPLSSSGVGYASHPTRRDGVRGASLPGNMHRIPSNVGVVSPTNASDIREKLLLVKQRRVPVTVATTCDTRRAKESDSRTDSAVVATSCDADDDDDDDGNRKFDVESFVNVSREMHNDEDVGLAVDNNHRTDRVDQMVSSSDSHSRGGEGDVSDDNDEPVLGIHANAQQLQQPLVVNDSPEVEELDSTRNETHQDTGLGGGALLYHDDDADVVPSDVNETKTETDAQTGSLTNDDSNTVSPSSTGRLKQEGGLGDYAHEMASNQPPGAMPSTTSQPQHRQTVAEDTPGNLDTSSVLRRDVNPNASITSPSSLSLSPISFDAFDVDRQRRGLISSHSVASRLEEISMDSLNMSGARNQVGNDGRNQLGNAESAKAASAALDLEGVSSSSGPRDSKMIENVGGVGGRADDDDSVMIGTMTGAQSIPMAAAATRRREGEVAGGGWGQHGLGDAQPPQAAGGGN